jgi:predicted metal-dependent RNase
MTNLTFLGATGTVTGSRFLLELNGTRILQPQQINFCRHRDESKALNVSVQAHIEKISGFSAHADYNEILAWLVGFNRPPQRTFLVHGEPDASASLAEKSQDTLGWDVVVPKFEESFTLD